MKLVFATLFISSSVFASQFYVDATAYDLGVESCGKTPEHPLYGITATGTNLANSYNPMVIAVDPNVIPLKSEVCLEFPEKWKHLDGCYFAGDTGGAIKGNRIDVFMQDHKTALNFGRQKVKVLSVKKYSPEPWDTDI